MAQFVSWSITSFARLLTAVRPVWQGLDPERPGLRVYFANHVSHGDFILIWTVLPPRQRRRTRPVAGADYWLRGALRRFIGAEVFRALLIARRRPDETPDTAAQTGDDPIALMAGALDQGDSLIIFPEGTRNLSDADLLEFRSGIWRLAMERPEVELVPVWIENLNRVLPKGAIIPVPLMCQVVFGAPIQLAPDEGKAEFLTRARAALLALKPNGGEA
ncbi:MAG: lysophospholipid acyltransferase family protein [Paracoccus sp. (in: a-proteobacteria)]|nr:lysophospholipid acyltransferase family protein [Paracoccus sp. (in: a-proteobacteria)]